MKHIFLTGQIQIGKSTIIRKTLSLLNMKYGGFCTYFGPDRAEPDRCLYMNDASQPQSYEEHNVIARFQIDYPPEVYTERFDNLGACFIDEARKKAQLIIMDECGDLERGADVFQKEILNTIKGEIPILGVIKLSSSGWVDEIRQHPKVKIIAVDENNREILPRLLLRIIKS